MGNTGQGWKLTFQAGHIEERVPVSQSVRALRVEWKVRYVKG